MARRTGSFGIAAVMLATGAITPTAVLAATPPADAGPLPAQLWWADAAGLHRALARDGVAAPVVAPRPASSAGPAAPRAGDPGLPDVPLGSTWKLFAYAWLQATGAHEPPYRCAAAKPAEDDEYCCEPGESVGRDEALARSCGPYFAPRRLGLAPSTWATFWRDRGAPAWLGRETALSPGTRVPVDDLLAGLDAIPAPARQAARAALLPLALRTPGVVPALGGGPRFKTWSWTVDGARAGGAAGWLADGTPFWFGAPGTSRTALAAQAAWIARTFAAAGLAAPAPEPVAVDAEPCVAVTLFARYPIASVTGPDGRPARPGAITGPQRVRFANGQSLAIDASPAMQLHALVPGQPARGLGLEARWPLEDYVARVVDREGDASEPAAARALAVAARTYVLQNATLEEGCRRIADDSRTQRASPRPPTAGARAAAAFTDGLVLAGPPVRYHQTQGGDGVLSWRDTVVAARDGAPYDALLARAYPRARLAALAAADDCVAQPEARDWLLAAQRRWRATLRTQAGWEPLPADVAVCRLAWGVPHSDQRRLEIRVRDWTTQDGRVTLVHEYLHLAFRHHPNGRDDTFVERLARQLVDS